MEIKWRNIIALILIVFTAGAALRVGPQLIDSLRSVRGFRVGQEDRVFALCVLGLLLVTLVVLVRLLVQKNQRKP